MWRVADLKSDIRGLRGRARIRRSRALVRRRLLSGWPPPGFVRFGSLGRIVPIGRHHGAQRGTPVDRIYIEAFLGKHAARPLGGCGDISGRVLEIGDDRYTRRFGGWNGSPSATTAVKFSDVLDIRHDNPRATIVANLVDAPHVPSDCFDCIVCTQTLYAMYHVQAAIGTLHRILAPGGVLLLTVPGISPAVQPDREWGRDFWRFTLPGVEQMLAERFPVDRVAVRSYGNPLSAVAFIHGLAAEELARESIDAFHPDFEVTIAGCARKAPAA